jgi:thiol:disulfide interchange protein
LKIVKDHGMKFAPGWCALATLCLLTGCEVGTEIPTGAQSSASSAAADPTLARPASPSTEQQVARGYLQFVEGYDRGYQQALEQSKPMLVFFTAQWCHYCHEMANEAFTSPQVVGLSEKFVCILVDADAEPGVCQQFRVQGFPTVQFVSPRGVALNRVVGKKPSHQLMMAMQAALQNVARRSEPSSTVRQ